jgi:hypothetical protein
MSFAINLRAVPFVMSYADAVQFYERTVPWRNGGLDSPLVGKRHRSTGVRMDGDDVVFRYHSTDVVRWHKHGGYTINTGGYSSRSTSEFATNFMPHGHAMMHEARYLRVDQRVYPVWGAVMHVSAEGVVSGPGLGMFKERSANRKKAREMLKEMGYYEYLAWHKLMYPMVKDTMPPSWRRELMAPQQVFMALKVGQEEYHSVMMALGGEPDTVREKLYMTYGDQHDIWDVTHHESLPYTANFRRYNIVMRST